jgi:hypothetical protein
METLEKLISNIKAEAANVESLKHEKDVAEENIRQAINKNYKDIIKPVLEQYSDLLNVIAHALGKDSSKMPPVTDRNNLPCGLQMSINYVYIGFSSYKDGFTCQVGVGQACKTNSCTSLNFSCWASVDGAKKSLDELTDRFCDYLESCIVKLKDVSASLTAEVQRLKDILSTSNTVQKNDDGTVEITLGGVHYKGTIVKE